MKNLRVDGSGLNKHKKSKFRVLKSNTNLSKSIHKQKLS